MKCIQCGTELMTESVTTNCLCDSCQKGNHPNFSLWQVCPKCGGQGKTFYPPNMPWNQTFLGDGSIFDCDVCKGKKIISLLTGLPPD